jgi:hypothetical protein
VTAPISTDSSTERTMRASSGTRPCAAKAGPGEPLPAGGEVAPHLAHATSAEAAPPTPLKAATISGICVICTRVARSAPMAAPSAIPATIIHGARMRPDTSVTTTAISIPVAAIWFPRRAVAGEPSRLRPTMKSAAARR